MKKLMKFLVLFVVVSLIGLSPAKAAYSIFMQIEGIPGESTDPTHMNWCDTLSFTHSISKPLDGAPQHASFLIAKKIDKSSPTVNLKLNQGATIPAITVDFQKVVNTTTVVFYKVQLADVIITKVDSTGSAGDSDILYDNVSITYGRITWTYYPVDAKGKVGTPVTTSWILNSKV